MKEDYIRPNRRSIIMGQNVGTYVDCITLG